VLPWAATNSWLRTKLGAPVIDERQRKALLRAFVVDIPDSQRENIAGASLNQLGDEVGLNGNTLPRIEEERAGCYPSSAKKLADRFGLRVLELFEHTDGEDHLTVVDAGALRDRLSLTS
jgi:ribosome-binding protein aMBF1 (putative translation factor)